MLKKLISILSESERRQLGKLVPMVIVMALLETAGVASIVPFLGLLSDEHALTRSAFLSQAYALFSFSSREQFFFAVGLSVLGVFLTSNVWSALTTWRLISFTNMRAHALSVRLLESYLHRPWAFFLKNNTADLGKNILSEVHTVVTGILGQFVNLSARVVVIGAILSLLIVIDPVMAFGVFIVFGGVYGVIYYSLRRRATLRGRERVSLNQAQYKIAQEALAGAKELKLYGLENVAVEAFSRVSYRFARLAANNAVSVQLPRFAIETVAFGGVLVMVLMWLRGGQPLEQLLPVLGLYAFAAYRMLPSLQTAFASFNSLRFNLGSLDVLVADLQQSADIQLGSPEPTPPAPFRRHIRLQNVSFRYETATRQTLDTIFFEQRPREWVAFVGSTGAGKTTIVDVLLAVLEPDTGCIFVDDEELADAISRVAWQRNCAYVPQSIFLVDDTVLHNIAFGVPPGEVNRDRATWAATIAQLHDFIERELPKGYDTVVGERGMRLSGGQRQRIGIARALYRNPKYLVLDEATSALDNTTEARFFAALRSELSDVAVVSIAHRLSTTRTFDRIIMMDNGRIVDAGNYETLRARYPEFWGKTES
jgi:ABC-type multidrug transport system fused ATPase/permease subunit